MTHNKTTALPFVCSLLFFFPTFILGNPHINTEDFQKGKIEMRKWASHNMPVTQETYPIGKAEKKQVRQEKILVRLEKCLQENRKEKPISGISDPVDKWFWVWSGLWALGILLTIIAGAAITGTALGLIWFFSFALGATALVIWLIKKFA